MDQLFTCERISGRVTRIRDVLGVAMYLVEGDDKACLLDTGHGLGNLREYVETLTRKPVFVILTHAHVDHAGAAALWDEVWMNPLDEGVYREHSAEDFRRREFARHERAASVPESMYVKARTGGFFPLRDGQIFDLGGVTLEAVWTPGHTPGMTMVLIREERIILFGDGCGLEVLLIFPDSSTVTEYKKTLLKVKRIEGRYDRIIRNHGTCESPKELLDNCIDCCTKIFEGRDEAQRVSFGGFEVLSACAVDACHQRLDKKQGNILYTEDKRR